MNIAVFAISARGKSVGKRCAEALNGKLITPRRDELKASLSEIWHGSDAVVMIGSTGVAVRVTAPLLRDKETDPAVIVVTEDGELVLPLTGAHLGGGADLSRTLASNLGAHLVSTTSTDRMNVAAPDLLCSRWGWKLEGRKALVQTNGALLVGRKLLFWVDENEETPPFPEGYLPCETPDEADVVVSPRALSLGSHQVQLVPPSLVAGMGCRKGVDRQILKETLLRHLSEQGYSIYSLGEIRTSTVKSREKGLLSLAEELGVPLTKLEDEEIRSIDGNFSASAATAYFDLPGVAEPCAASAGRLIGPRSAERGTTVALGHRPARIEGKLYVVGTGPGDRKYMTFQAKEAIDDSDAVVGYRLYVDQLPEEWLKGKKVERYGMGEEEARVASAMALARKGFRVSLVSGGDPILFGMAGLARNMAEDLPVEVVPGLSAAQLAGASAGAPYSNGLIMLSLSDYLQPWESIKRALSGAASTGLTVALYNPVRRDLDVKLEGVKKTYSTRTGQTVWLMRDVGRPGESVKVMDLSELTSSDIDMRTLLLLPGEATVARKGYLVDTRGYHSERKKRT